MLCLLETALWAAGLLFSGPSLLFFLECILYRTQSPAQNVQGADPSFVVVMPAHNEEATIAHTLAGLKAALRAPQRILVVADNCQDQTTHIARDAGAEVIERENPEERGKGYALAFAFEHLKKAPPDVTIVLDADCIPSAGALEHIAKLALQTGRPVQADYLLMNPQTSLKERVSAFALRVKNRIRPSGMMRLHIPVPLTGSGMAFPRDALEKAPPLGSWLAEDMLLGIALARLGLGPIYCREAEVRSELPDEQGVALRQRRRWEHGHLGTLFAYAPKLILEGLISGRAPLVLAGLDLAIPPLALFSVVLFGLLATSLILSAHTFNPGLMVLQSANVTLLFIGVMTSWLREGRDLLSLKDLLRIPGYILWKLPLYLSFFRRGQHGTWERTKRREER